MPKKPSHGRGAPLSVSQNFLTSARTIRRLLALTALGRDDLVVEIGPGKGHITRELLARCGAVRAAELDPRLCARLVETFGKDPRFSLFQGDFFSMPLPGAGPYQVFSNIPFSRTTDIVRRLTQAKNPPAAAWLIVEAGAAKRFCGQSRENLLASSLRPFFELKIAARLQRQDFHPAPSVDTVLLCIRQKEAPDLPLEERAAYRGFLERAWKQGLRSLLTKKQIATALRLAGLPQPAPDSNLLYVQWLCLFRCWRQFGASRKNTK